MIQDELVEIFGARFACVDKGFGRNTPVDVVIRPEDMELVSPEQGTLTGVCTHLILKASTMRWRSPCRTALSGWYTVLPCAR